MIRKINCPYCDTMIGVPAHVDFISTVRCSACHGFFHFDVNTNKATPRATRNYYEIFGLEPEAADETIKLRFRELMKRFHPDRNPHQSEKAKTLTKLLNEAYSVLGSPAERSSYNVRIAAQLPSASKTADPQSSVDAWPEDQKPRWRSWGWAAVLLFLVILFFAHHGIPIGLRSFGDYYTDRITMYNAPQIIRYLRNKNHPVSVNDPAASDPSTGTSLTVSEIKR